MREVRILIVNEDLASRGARTPWFDATIQHAYSLDHLVRPDDFQRGRRAELIVGTGAAVPTADKRFVIMRITCTPEDLVYASYAAIELFGAPTDWSPDDPSKPVFRESVRRMADDLNLLPGELHAYLSALIAHALA